MIQIDVQLDRFTFALSFAHPHKHTFSFVDPKYERLITVRHGDLYLTFDRFVSLDAPHASRSTLFTEGCLDPEYFVAIINQDEVLSCGAKSGGVYS